VAFLAGNELLGHGRWIGTLLTDRYNAYDTVLDVRVHPDRRAAACVAHARRKFDDLAKVGMHALTEEATRHFGLIYVVEGEHTTLHGEERRVRRQELARPQWDKFRQWLKLERRLVVDGGTTAGAIDYKLNRWTALTCQLGAVGAAQRPRTPRLPQRRAAAATYAAQQPQRATAAAPLAPQGSRRHSSMKSLEVLIEDGGEITVGAIGPIECAATAAGDHNALAMLVRRKGETLNALLRRLDRAIARYYDTGEATDEINPPSD
jgi:hypothetical protein